MHTCKLCEKNFVSHFGLTVHVRSHICCKGCKKVLPSKLVFNSHKLTCKKYKKLMNKRGRRSKQKETISSPCKPSMSQNKHDIVQEKTLKCSLCPKTFQLNQALKVHMTRIHLKKKNLSNTNEDSSWTMPLELTDTHSLWQVSHFNNNVVKPISSLCPDLYSLKDSFGNDKTHWKHIFLFYLLLYLPNWYFTCTRQPLGDFILSHGCACVITM